MQQTGAATVEAGDLRENFFYANNNQSKILVMMKTPGTDPLLLFTANNPSFEVAIQGTVSEVTDQIATQMRSYLKDQDAEFSPAVVIRNPEKTFEPYRFFPNGSMTADELVNHLAGVLMASDKRDDFVTQINPDNDSLRLVQK